MSDQTAGPVYDVVIVGAGPGGYVAAIRASQLGLKTAVVEREHLGGICLNWGCIPTKALLRSAEVYHLVQSADEYGVKVGGNIEPDAAGMVARSRAVSSGLGRGVAYLLQKNNVDVIWGEATITKPPSPSQRKPGYITVAATTKPPQLPKSSKPSKALGPGDYAANAIIVATGAAPRILPGLEPDGKTIWTYFDAMRPKQIPASLLIIGSGAIGVEFASFYRTLGSQVTIVEAEPAILPAEDEEISTLAHKAFERQGMTILTATTVTSATKSNNAIVADLSSARGTRQKIKADCLISAVGVVANTAGLGLEQLGVELEHGTIRTTGAGRTNIDGIYAIGDVAGPPMLAHKAEHEGVACVEMIAGHADHVLDRSQIPGCTYSRPQIASVGMTQKQAEAAGHSTNIGRFPFSANGKALAMGETDGLIKTIFDANTGELLGAHLIGSEVTELIQGFVVAMQLETTEEDLMRTIFPHPTLSEMMHESVLNAYARAIHI